MSGIIRRRPSPSMLVAGAALIVALAGSAMAGPLATKSGLNKQEKKQVNKLIKKAAPGLSVANASTVDGANASDLRTSSAFSQNTTVIPNLGSSFVTVASTTITTQGSGRILAIGTATLRGADQNELGSCRVQIDGIDGFVYVAEPDDIGADNRIGVTALFAVTRPAGTYTANLQCAGQIGMIGKEVAGISAYGLGA
jgi:hypothetical protein